MTYRYKTVKRNGKTVLLHRWLMEQRLGRPLERREQVHHKNGDRYDNRLENLELLSIEEHQRGHKLKYPLTKVCTVCGAAFTPHKTKRKRQQTCSPGCRAALIAIKRHGTAPADARSRIRAGRASLAPRPEVAEALVRANVPEVAAGRSVA